METLRKAQSLDRTFPTKYVTTNMAICRKMEHLREWKQVVFWDTASEAPPPELEFLEILQYPGLPKPVMNMGKLDDPSLSSWFSKGVRLK